MENRRLLAVLVLVFVAFAALWLVITAFREFPRGLDSALLVLLGLWLAWQAVRRVGGRRALFAAAALLAFVLALVGVLATLMILDLLFIGACVGVAYVMSARIFRLRSKLPQAPRPNHPVVIWNPKSGGGKALAAGLAQQARERGIEPIELAPGDDLEALVRQAITDGADALAAAGGD
ncbi:MAG: diacylglycerol kinase family protein, partial [Actinomycetes bacterium]